MGALGIVTCEVLEMEFAYLLANDTDVDKITRTAQLMLFSNLAV